MQGVVRPIFPVARILIKTDTEVDAASYPGIPKYRNPDLIIMPTPPPRLQLFADEKQCVFFFLLLSFSKKNKTRVRFRLGLSN